MRATNRRTHLSCTALGGLVLLSLAACTSDAEQDSTERDESGAITEEGDLGVFALNVGDCVNSPDDTEDGVSSMTGVPCDEPHDGEVFGTIDSTATEFPGDAELQSEADEVCAAEFETYVGIEYAVSELFFQTLIPTQQTWDDQDDREIVCIAVEEEGQLTGSVEGAAR